MGLRLVLASLLVGIGAAMITGLTYLAAGTVSWTFGGWHFAPGARPATAVVASALAGATLALITAAIFRQPTRTLWQFIVAGGSVAAVRIGAACLAIAWLILVVVLTGVTGQPGLIPASLSILFLLAACATALHTASLLDDRENRLEIRHDIVGIGGGIGAWRISPAAAGALLTLLLLAGAWGLATAGLHAGSAPAPSGKSAAKPPEKPPPAGSKE